MPVILAATVALGQENAPKPRLALDAPAPGIAATTVDGKTSTLEALRGTGNKIVVLQFASLSDPIFRTHTPTVEKLAAREGSKAQFVIIYQKEAHPDSDPLEINTKAGISVPEQQDLAARTALARQTVDQLNITSEMMLVDAWNNATAARYGSLPNMTFIIDGKGVLQASYPFMDPAKVQAAVDTLAAGKPLPAELRGSVQANGLAPFDFSGAAADMTGGRGPASIASALERATLSDQQKQAVLVAIAEFMANMQDFRASRGAATPAATRAAATAPARGAASAPGTPAAARGDAVPDLPTAQANLKASADHLKTVVKQNMNAKDAPTLLAALDAVAPAQHLFTNP